MLPRYGPKDVAKHCTEKDCWIVIHGAVFNVTEFLKHHPGGISAISKPGRAGKDVTTLFDKVGHSSNARAILESLQIGILESAITEDPNDELSSLLSSNASKECVDHEYAVRWHASRRQAILKNHPEIANLMGSNPWTCAIGASTFLMHCYICIIVQADSCPWYIAVILAYTVGAFLKMYQFAVNHEICHDTAGSLLKNHDWLKRCALQVFTLPSLAGTIHAYCEFQHIGHHTGLGSQALADLNPANSKDPATGIVPDGAWRKTILFPDGDGDLVTLGTLSLGRLVQSWREEQIDGETIYAREYLFGEALQNYHNNNKLVKCLAVQLFHVQHHLAMTMTFLNALIVIPPVSIPLFFWPGEFTELVLARLNGGSTKSDQDVDSNDLSASTRELAAKMFVLIMGSFGLHAWLWVALDLWLLVLSRDHYTWISVLKGLLYLYISELCMYGFGMHPYMGYFLGTHCSGGEGFSSSSVDSPHGNLVQPSSSLSSPPPQQQQQQLQTQRMCQPTMSTYSLLASFASMNLTHHVEHHDFPGIPWNRLPEVTRIAPEYYEHLEKSSGFYNTIYQWVHYSGGWGYACQ